MNEEIVYANNDGIYIGCEMVCVEPVIFHGLSLVDVGTKVIVYGYDGIDILIQVPHQLNPFREWSIPKKYFKLVEYKEPAHFSFTTNSNFITVQQMRNVLSRIGDGDGVFEKWHSGDFETVWTYKEEIPKLSCGDIVNHIDTDRNGVIYNVDETGIHVRFWDGGKEVFQKGDLRLVRGD
ncbi:hypothetical protein HPMBJEAJ_00039 [Aeromonas phage avDM6]|nr:hypothetical protein HPMBJEAJ_00039 [Aeromonas phage avDM6]